MCHPLSPYSIPIFYFDLFCGEDYFSGVFVYEHHPIITRYSHFDILHSSIRLPPRWSHVSGRKIFPSLTLGVSSHHIVIIPCMLFSCRLCLLHSNTISQTTWNVKEAWNSSSYRELKVIALHLDSILHLVIIGYTIKWCTDNPSVSRIVEIASMNEDSTLRYAFSLCACLTTSSWNRWLWRMKS